METIENTTLSIQPDYPGDLNFYYKGVPNGLYFYYLNRQKIFSSETVPEQAEEILAIPPIDNIQSVTFCPYFEEADFKLRPVAFDAERFPMDNKLQLAKSTFYRIEHQYKNRDMESITNKVTCYKKEGTTIGGVRNWRNEGKLHQFPFKYGVLSDGIMSPVEFKYHLCPTNKPTITINKPLTNFGTYGIFINGYKNDALGLLEDNISTASNQVPLVSSAYSNYMAANKAQVAAQQKQALVGGLISTVGAAAAGFAVGGPAGAAVGAATSGVSALMSINSIKATQNDLKDTPNAIKSVGSADFLYNALRNTPKGLYHTRLKYTDEYMERIGDFFAMYGYKQDRVMRPNLRNRNYYNYIKTVGVNITCKDGVGIPKEHFNKLKSIYDNGTTIWHIARSGVNVGDYSMDNVEV